MPAKVQEACLVQSMIGLYKEENTAYLRAAVTEHLTLTGETCKKTEMIRRG